VVLVGMGERTTHQAVLQVARALFRGGAATRVIGCLMPKSRAAMHLDTVFSFCDRDAVTLFREVVDQIRCYSVYPSDARARWDRRSTRRADSRLPWESPPPSARPRT
jgi:arginine deiminase